MKYEIKGPPSSPKSTQRSSGEDEETGQAKTNGAGLLLASLLTIGEGSTPPNGLKGSRQGPGRGATHGAGLGVGVHEDRGDPEVEGRGGPLDRMPCFEGRVEYVSGGSTKHTQTPWCAIVMVWYFTG